MCGIAGYLLAGRREQSSARVRSALAAMRHRGPDDEGIALLDPGTAAAQRLVTGDSDPGVRGCETAGAAAELPHSAAFGHRRFSIVDPSPDGHQPFWSEDGALCAAFNGEIYNYVELRRELEQLGRRFRTASDAEVLVAAFQEWGTGCFARFDGFFALSLWDARSRRVLLARDRIGKAPLYLWQDGEGLFWASELRALFALNDAARRRVNARALVDFVEHGVRDVRGESCYEGVESFPRASHAWLAADGSFAPESYWSLPQQRMPRAQVSSEDAAREVERLLREAVRVRLRADVPVCVQLSGGVDSSAILALAAQQSERVTSYTVHFDETDSNEEPFARLAAERYRQRVDSHVIRPPDDDLVGQLDGYVELMGAPFHSPNQLASQRVWRAMQAHGQKVVLYGAGGDEAFAGYAEEYQLPFLRHLLRRGALGAWLRETLRSTDKTPGSLLFAQARRYASRLRRNARGGAPADGDVFRRPEGVEPRDGPADDIETLLRENMTDWRMSYWVRLDNQNSMGVPVELRCPFLDHRLVEYAFRLPLEYLIHDGWLKWILRRAMVPHLPPEVVWRRRKMGFPFPLRSFLARRKPELLRALASLDSPYVDLPALCLGYDSLQAGNPRRLWCILSVALWWKRCIQRLPLV
jgi:asparagine synthase (glutamine-hydrolysing)